MNKKGFTLIELLAVIIILAIISLIVVPQILKVIDSSKESSYRSSVDGIYSAMQMYYAETVNYMGQSKFTYKNGRLTCTENCGTDKNIPITGSMGSDAEGWGYVDRGDTKVAIYKTDKCYYRINGGSSVTEKMAKEECKKLANG